MKHLFYPVIIFLSFTLFLSTGFIKPVSAVWKFDTNFPTCSLTITPPGATKGTKITAIANASTPLSGPSKMYIIDINLTPPVYGQPPWGALSCPNPGLPAQQCTIDYTSSPSDLDDITFLAKPENSAGNIGACLTSYKFDVPSPWLKTFGGDVHANR